MSSEKPDTRIRILEATWRLLEEHPGEEVKMADIARAAGISRQAVYLHFASRTDLLIATTAYVDEVKGLAQRLDRLRAVDNGIAQMQACVELWGNYLPEIYGVARALLRAKDTDEAAAAAWKNSMGCLRSLCNDVVITLEREGHLVAGWSSAEAVDLFFTLLSVENWEHLRRECRWSKKKYIDRLQRVLIATLVQGESMVTPTGSRGNP